MGNKAHRPKPKEWTWRQEVQWEARLWWRFCKTGCLVGRHIHGSYHNILYSACKSLPQFLTGTEYYGVNSLPERHLGSSPSSLSAAPLNILFPPVLYTYFLSYVLNSPLEWAHPQPLSIPLSLCLPRLFPFVTFRAATSISCHSKLAMIENGPL